MQPGHRSVTFERLGLHSATVHNVPPFMCKHRNTS